MWDARRVLGEVMTEMGHYCYFCDVYHTSTSCYHPARVEFDRVTNEINYIHKRIAEWEREREREAMLAVIEAADALHVAMKDGLQMLERYLNYETARNALKEKKL